MQRTAGLSVLLLLVLFCYLSNNDGDGSSMKNAYDVIMLNNKHEQLLDGCGAPMNMTREADNNETGEVLDDDDDAKLFCSDEHRRAVKYCSQTNNNKVPMRENQLVPTVRSWGELRPYSISSISLAEDILPPQPRCRNLRDYLSAIKFGTRRAGNSSSSQSKNTDETTPSVFVPLDCFVPSLPPPPAKTCDILDQYDHVIFHGDSLTRHLRQAIYMSMRGDYVRGGVMTHDPHVLEHCKCDGTFSESRTCRRDMLDYFRSTIIPRDVPGEEKLCSNASFSFGKRQMEPWLPRRGKPDPGGSIDWDPVNCADPKYKGVLLVLQGGLHWTMNASDTFASMVQPVVTHPKYQECACLGKVRLIWVTMHSQSTALDGTWPHQSRANALLFNEAMRNSFISIGLVPGEDLLILDWLNMTVNAQSSDGMHSLSDINLAKAAQIIYLSQHWPFPKPYSVC